MKRLILILVLLVIGCTSIEPLTKEICESSGGRWNECGSSCRGMPPDTMCIQVCVEYCECENNQECPKGYECAEYVGYVGVCK